MYKFGKKSLQQLATVREDLRAVLKETIKVVDFSVIEGRRDKEAQDKAFAEGRSKVRFPRSAHNAIPPELSKAADCVPYPIIWPDPEKQDIFKYARAMGRFYFLAGVIYGIAHMMKVNVRWGGFFKRWFDGPHYEVED
jgi:peptidoglycan L-alanyl-D-glutamate endopeptidase CwlK